MSLSDVFIFNKTEKIRKACFNHTLPCLEQLYPPRPSLPVFINEKLARLPTGENIEISYGPEIKVDVILAGNTIKKNLKVDFDVDIRCNANGKYYGKNLGVIFDEKRSLIYFGRIKGINGGAHYKKEKCYNMILEKLGDNKNPFVSQELKLVLEEVQFGDNQLTLQLKNLPYDLKACIEELIAFLNKCYNPQDSKEIFYEIARIFNSQEIKIEYWDFLSIFLQLDCIKRLRVSHSRKIINSILDRAKPKAIKKLIKRKGLNQDEVLSKKVFLEEIRQKSEYFVNKYSEIHEEDDITTWNLITWIIQILDTRPKQEQGLIAHLNEDKKYFKNKLLIFQDYSTCKIFLKDYIQSYEKNENNLVIKFNSALMEINVGSENINAEIFVNDEIGLLEYINQHKEGNEFTISRNSRFLKPGKYSLQIKPPKQEFIRMTKSCLLKKNDRARKFILTSNKVKYTLNEKEIDDYKYIYIKNQKNDKKINFYSTRHCDTSEKVLKMQSINYTIPFNKGNKSFIIEDYEDNNIRKINQLKIINKERAFIKNILSKRRNLLKSILNDYISNQMKTLSDDIISLMELESSKINKSLKEIIAIYKDEFNLEKSEKKLLKNIALTANYQVLIAKEKSVDVEQAMKLLKASKLQLEGLANQNIIPVFGVTGSGKSTVCCYLLGAKLMEKDSIYGGKIIINSSNQKDFPIIGQSIGTSETLYCKGYQLKGKYQTSETVLCDCPGFYDTRGTEYELCTNLSIDQAIKKAKSIKAVLLVVPYSAFIVNRGRALLSEIGNLLDIMPKFLSKETILKSVFIIITKAGSDIDLGNLKERTEKNIREISEQIEKNFKRFSSNQSDCSALGIWQIIKNLLSMNHIFLVNCLDKRAPNTFLEALLKAPALSKEEFSSTLLSREMIKEYGKLIEMSTHTWHKIIIPDYLKRFPEALMQISQKRENLMSKIKKIAECETEAYIKKESLLNDQQANKEKSNSLSELIEKFRSKEIQEEEINAFITSNEKLISFEGQLKLKIKQLKGMRDKLKTLESEQNDIKNEINDNDNKITDYQKIIKENSEKKTELSTGSTEETLYSYSIDPNCELVVNSIKAGADKNALNEVRQLDNRDFLEKNMNLGLASSYRGILYHHIALNKDYRIVPIENQNEFFRQNLTVQSDNKNYCATIEGEYFKLSYKPKATPDGKKMIWPIETHWVGQASKIPWFNIIHSIPNLDLNEATLINLDIEISAYHKELLRIRVENKYLSKNYDGKEKKYAKLLANFETEQALYEEEKNLQLTDNLEGAKQSINRQLQDIERQFEYLNDQQEANLNEKNELLKQIENLELEEKEILEKKKHLALLILKQMKSANALYEFCLTFSEDCYTLSNFSDSKSQLIKDCREFISIFSRDKTKLEQMANDEIYPACTFREIFT